MKKILVLVLTAVALAGCATALTEQGQRIIRVDENKIKDCKFLGEVAGHSSYGGFVMQETGKNYAMNEAINQAGQMNATHIVFTKAEGGYFGGQALGRAYSCKK